MQFETVRNQEVSRFVGRTAIAVQQSLLQTSICWEEAGDREKYDLYADYNTPIEGYSYDADGYPHTIPLSCGVECLGFHETGGYLWAVPKGTKVDSRKLRKFGGEPTYQSIEIPWSEIAPFTVGEFPPELDAEVAAFAERGYANKDTAYTQQRSLEILQRYGVDISNEFVRRVVEFASRHDSVAEAYNLLTGKA